MKIIKTKNYKSKAFCITYVHVITDKNYTIKGGSFFLLGKNRMTIAFANTLWVDDAGRPYWCRLKNRKLYFFNMSFAFKQPLSNKGNI